MSSYLITGGAGYIGSHIAERLIKKNNKVFVYDNLSTGSKKLVNKKANFMKGDINDYLKLSNLINKYKIENIIHFAAYINVAEAELNKKKYFYNNVIGTRNLLKAIKLAKNNVENIIFASSCTVYKARNDSINEGNKVQPSGYYGYTKSVSEKDIIKFSKKNNIKYAILRYFNVAGASNTGKLGEVNRKNGHLFKNLAIQSLKRNKTIYIYGRNFNTYDGTCIRDYIHILDLIDIHLKTINFLDTKKKSLILNCGYGKGYSVLEIVNCAKKIIKNLKVKYKKKRKGDIGSAYCSNILLKKKLYWKPKYNKINLMLKSALKWEKKLNRIKQV